MERDARNADRLQSGSLLLIPLLGVLFALVYVFTRPLLYEATGTVRLVPSSLQAPPPPGLPPGFLYYGPNAIRPHERADELQVLTSARFLRGVVAQFPRSLKMKLLDDEPESYTPDEISTNLVTELAQGLSIEGNQQNELMEISYDDPNPNVAAEVVNGIIGAAKNVGLELGLERNRRAATFFAGQIVTLRQHIRDAQERENALEQGPGAARRVAQRNAGSAFAPEASSGGRDDPDPELGPLIRASTQARLDQRLAQGEVRLLELLGNGADPTGESGRQLMELNTHLSRVEAEYASLGATLGPNQPQMRARAAAIQRYREQLALAGTRQLQNARLVAAETARNAKLLDTETKRRLQALQLIEKDQVQDAMLEIDLTLNLNVYEAIRAKLQSAKINAGLGATDLQVIDEAYPPVKPIPRKFAIPIALGLFAGILISIVPALYFGERRQYRWSVDTMERRLELPALAILSQQPAAAMRVGESLPADFEDSLRMLAAELLLLPREMSVRGRAQVMLFTSAAPSEGKTSTICSFAMVRAREGKRVLLIDADLHRPAVHKYFGLSGRLGVSSILNHRATVAEALQTVSYAPGVTVLAAGPVSPSPSDLLNTQRFLDLVAQAARDYDLVLIDSPPVLALLDSVSISVGADVVLLVTRHGVVTLAQAARARFLLDRANAPLGGMIINGAPAQ